MNNVEHERAHLARLAAAEPTKRFRRVYRLVCQPAWLEMALDAIRTNKGFNTPGVDGVKGTDLTQEQLDKLAEKLRAGAYQPRPVRRVFIPKRNGKRRPLGFPSAEDKVVQSAIKLILEPCMSHCSAQLSRLSSPTQLPHGAPNDCLARDANMDTRRGSRTLL